MTVPVAFIAGVAAFFSPCVLPLLPVWLAFLGGSKADSKVRRVLCFSLLVVLLTGCASLGSSKNNDDISTDPAPYFELVDLKGQVVMLYFWTATCPPCIEKLGDLSVLQDQLPEDAVMLLINVGDSEQRIKQLVTNYPNLNVLLNGRDVFYRYQIRFAPTTVLIDKDGIIVISKVGAMEIGEALNLISEFR